ncbi:MAG: cell wall-binding repeat-containing protein [Erysipelotrichaceae bacterium]|nr:cell wall-binding repeat-containing protein [Erysipelotrichaceae bacterium]
MKRLRISLSLLFALMLSVSQIFSDYIIYEAATAPTNIRIEENESAKIPSRINGWFVEAGSTDRYEFYLPGGVDLNNVFVSWDGDATVTVNGTTYTSGTLPVPALNTSDTYTFKNGNSTLVSYKFVTYQGSDNENVQRVFIEIDESEGHNTIAQMDGSADHSVECTGRININGTWYELKKMKGRGNATWKESRDKRPYNVTIGKKINFPGVDSDPTSKWSFMAEILDRSLLGNRAGFYLAEQLGIGQSTTHADVWMNGEYQGCYMITPKTDSFVTKTGYMIEQDNYKEDPVSEGGDPQFTLEGLKEASGWDSCYNRITVKDIGSTLTKLYPDAEYPEEEVALKIIKPWLQTAWDAIRNKQSNYTDYIDIVSFARMYLMHEYIKSYDICAGSILYHRDGDTDADKLIAGPLWDLDNAMGSVYQNGSLGRADDRRNGDRRSAQGDFIQNITEYKTSVYKTISNCTGFMEEVKKQYTRYHRFFDNLATDFDKMAADIRLSAEMNFKKVKELGTSPGKNNHYYSSQTTLGSGEYRQVYVATTTWSDYVANMRTYIETRSRWFANKYYDENYVCNHVYEDVVTAPTCQAAGYTTHTCTICGESYVDTPIAIIPHQYVDDECTMCHQQLLYVTFECSAGTSVTVYEKNDFTSNPIENATVVHPRDKSSGWIECGGDGQVNFLVIVDPGFVLEPVTAGPEGSFKNLKGKEDTGIENGYRMTKVTGNPKVTVKAYTYLSFDSNGGTGTMGDQQIYGNVEVEIQSNTFEKEGYLFNGWNTKADGTGTAYRDNETTAFAGPTVLYAQWRLCTISFVDENGESLQNVEVEVGATPSYTAATPVKAANADYWYEFSGWTPNIVPAVADATYTAVYTAHDRSYGAPVWSWTPDEDGYTATASFTTNDGKTEFTETVDATVQYVTVDPTCLSDGTKTYTASVTYRGNSYTDNKVDTLTALGHDMVFTGYTHNAEGNEAYANYECSRCDYRSQNIVLATDKDTYDVNEEVLVTFNYPYAAKHWIGLYRKGETYNPDAGGVKSIFWGYFKDINNPFSILSSADANGRAGDYDAGQFTVVLFSDDSYNPVVSVDITVTKVRESSLETNKGHYKYGEAINVTSATGFDTGWVGLYDYADSDPLDKKLLSSYEVNGQDTRNINNGEQYLKPGNYKVILFKRGYHIDSGLIKSFTVDRVYNLPTVVFSEDKSQATFTFIATDDDKIKIEQTVDTTSKVTKEPTCTETGIMTYTATLFMPDAFYCVNDSMEFSTTDTSVIPENGHTPGQPKKENEVPSTCTEEGSYDMVVRCTVCNAVLSSENFTTEPTGHNWGEPTYTWSDDNLTVTATRVCSNDNHPETETVNTTNVITPPTCTADGSITYTAEFKNSAFSKQTKTVAGGSATGHTHGDAIIENEIAPTCTEAGSYQSVVYCTVCGKELSRETKTVEALGHNWGQWTVKTQPTCTEEGTEERECSRCGATETQPVEALGHLPGEAHEENRVEPTCEIEGSYDMVVRCTRCNEVLSSEHHSIPATGHTPGEPVREHEVGESCTGPGSYDEVVYCTVCGKELSRETKTVEALGHSWGEWGVTKEPTCTEKGTEERVCSRCGETETQDINPLGHDWNAPTYSWSDDYSKVTATRTCNNGDHPETETVNSTSEVTKAATCTERGEITYTGVFTNSAFEKQIKKVETPALGHSWSEWKQTKDPGCETKGEKTRTCLLCGEKETEEIAALGHDWGEATYTWSNNNESCEASMVCNRDSSHRQTEKATVTKKETAPTCTEAGSITYTATFKNTVFKTQSKTVEGKPATDHNWGAWTFNGEEAKTHTRVCANDSKHTETEPCDFEVTAEGNTTTYTCRVCGGSYSKTEETPVIPEVNAVIRVAGANRFGTSEAIAAAYKQNSQTDKLNAVILANGDNFADALAGSYLAAGYDAPIIITRQGKETEINNYIKSILVKGGTVYVLGGTTAVPESCLKGLSGYKIERLAGENRYLTNLEILNNKGIEGDTILVSTGTNFADSLSASATGLPILLVKDDGLTNEQKAFLSQNKGKKFIILGGINAVKQVIENQLKSYGNVERIQGANRAATSIEIAKKFFPDATQAVIAYSHDFPDGLCGGPLANQINAPLLLTRDADADKTAAYLKSKGIKTGYVLGGTAKLTDALVKSEFEMRSSDKIIDFE